MSCQTASPADLGKRAGDAAALSIAGLTKVFRGGKLANETLDLEVDQGEVFGLLGPNGAGKTTLLKQIMGLLRPTQGSIALHGVDLVAQPHLARKMCSYLPQGEVPISSYKVREAAVLTGRIRGGSKLVVRERVDRLLAGLELTEWQDELGIKLSGGIKRLAGFVMTCAHPAPLIILDEPTNDVDPSRRRLLWNQVRGLSDEGMTVLLVTHNVLEAEHAVDRLAIIDRGRIVARGTPSSLKVNDRDRSLLRVHLRPGIEGVEPPDFALSSSRRGHRLHLVITDDDVTTALEWARDLVRRSVAEEYNLGAPSLEDLYLRLVGRDDPSND